MKHVNLSQILKGRGKSVSQDDIRTVPGLTHAMAGSLRSLQRLTSAYRLRFINTANDFYEYVKSDNEYTRQDDNYLSCCTYSPRKPHTLMGILMRTLQTNRLNNQLARLNISYLPVTENRCWHYGVCL